MSAARAQPVELSTGAGGAMFGAVEAGGTKIVCGVGTAQGGSVETCRIVTGEPDVTSRQIVAFFRGVASRIGPVRAIGIGSFGPLDLDPSSPSYGAITSTPKPGWRGINLRALLESELGIAVDINTDVNAAALAEARYGAGRGRDSVAYVTVGTGIGVGILAGGRMVHGFGHPEAGHLMVPRHPDHGGFDGVCLFHGDCLEGMASGPAIKAAWGASLDQMDAGHRAWEVEAHYLAHLCFSLILTVAPAHIVLGGGVMSQSALLPIIRKRLSQILGGYAPNWDDPVQLDQRITGPGCHEPPGLLGGYLIAEQCFGRS